MRGGRNGLNSCKIGSYKPINDARKKANQRNKTKYQDIKDNIVDFSVNIGNFTTISDDNRANITNNKAMYHHLNAKRLNNTFIIWTNRVNVRDIKA